MAVSHARIPMLADASASSVCIGLSVALHAAVLLAVGAAPPHRATASWPIAKSLEVTLLADAGRSETSYAIPSIPTRSDGERLAAAMPPAVAPVKSVSVRAEGTAKPAAREEPRNIADTVAPDTGTILPVLAPDAFDPSRYRAMGELSVKPEPIGNIAVPYPEDEARRDVAKLKLTLYIDADGTVARAEPDRTELPEAFREAARSAFSRGRFKPGEIDGHAAPARMRVEVAFEQFAQRRGATSQRDMN